MTKEQQHYVPRFLLRHFTKGGTERIFVYDKSNDNVFQTNIKNIAAEKGFYDIEVGDDILSMEPRLAEMEANTSAIINKIITKRSLKTLDKHDLAVLAVFLAVQFVRSKEYRIRFEHLRESFIQKLRDMGATENDIRNVMESLNGLPEDKLFGFESIRSAGEFIPYFLNKGWILYETTNQLPFFISDNPMTLHNELNHGAYGNLGLAVRGIEIYFPLSTKFSLCLLCQSIAKEFQKAYENMKILDQAEPGRIDQVMNNPRATRAFCDELVNGTPIKVIEDSVTMINSLQVMYSSRFVYCEADKFSLVKRMISDNEKYREGLKPTVN